MKVFIFLIFALLARLEAKWQPKGRFEGNKITMSKICCNQEDSIRF